MKEKLAKIFMTKTRDEWSAIMEGTDVCFAPVLTMSEATKHPHMVARDVFVERDGVMRLRLRRAFCTRPQRSVSLSLQISPTSLVCEA